MRPDVNTLRRALESGGVSAEVTEEGFGVVLRPGATAPPAVLAVLKEAGYEMLVDLFASDTGEGLEVTYHLRSFAGDTEVYVRAGVPYDGTTGSVWESHPAALYAEREAAELFGMTFEGHPNPKRLLTSDAVPGFLMRKDVPPRTHEEVVRDA